MVKISSVALLFYPSLGLALQNARVLECSGGVRRSIGEASMRIVKG
jgi:hypothetical protein